MKNFYKITATIFVLMSFIGHLLESDMDILAAIAGVTYAILSLKGDA